MANVTHCPLQDICVPSEGRLESLTSQRFRFDKWRATRKYIREPIPDKLRNAALEMSRRYSPALVGRVLKLDPNRLKKPATKPSLPKALLKKPQTAFFKLPTEVVLPEPNPSSTQAATGCRLLLERPDGMRLTLLLPPLDLTDINRLCSDFWRS